MLEIALQNLQEELKRAILNEEIPVKVYPCYTSPYIGRIEYEVPVINRKFNVSVAEDFVCYHEGLLTGCFKDKEDLEALKALVKKYSLTKEQRAHVDRLQAEIDSLVAGKIYGN